MQRTATAFMVRPLRGVYLITPDFADAEAFMPRLHAALAEHPALVQYRNKSIAPDQRQDQARSVLAACRAHGVPMLVNDHVGLAAEIGADGVHLGGEDAPLRQAREQLGPQAIIGASCYDSFERARAARDAGASYLAFGAFAPSPTKPLARRAHPELLTRARALGLPCAAIGGIDARIAPELIAAGADLLAVISHVFDAPDPARAVRELRAAFQLSP
jgi:thiamine-phosphate pyrophosphorylase